MRRRGQGSVQSITHQTPARNISYQRRTREHVTISTGFESPSNHTFVATSVDRNNNTDADTGMGAQRLALVTTRR